MIFEQQYIFTGLSPSAIKDELIWPAKTLQHFVVAAAASRSH